MPWSCMQPPPSSLETTTATTHTPTPTHSQHQQSLTRADDVGRQEPDGPALALVVISGGHSSGSILVTIVTTSNLHKQSQPTAGGYVKQQRRSHALHQGAQPSYTNYQSQRSQVNSPGQPKTHSCLGHPAHNTTALLQQGHMIVQQFGYNLDRQGNG